MTDKAAEALVEALKRSAMQSQEQPLFKRGKVDGLFASRSGPAGEAAARALQEGLLEVVRRQTSGKNEIEWVRLSARGVEYLHEQESPLPVLEELRELLRTNQDAIPAWLASLQQEVKTLMAQVAESVERWNHRLEALSRRVDESLRRAEVGRQLPRGLTAKIPWALDAIVYLDRRAANGPSDDCSLPELYAALRQHHTDLDLLAFHEGLRRLHDKRCVQLLPFHGPAQELAAPEHALLDGSQVFYHVGR
jgi:hypothetical protein